MYLEGSYSLKILLSGVENPNGRSHYEFRKLTCLVQPVAIHEGAKAGTFLRL